MRSLRANGFEVANWHLRPLIDGNHLEKRWESLCRFIPELAVPEALSFLPDNFTPLETTARRIHRRTIRHAGTHFATCLKRRYGGLRGQRFIVGNEAVAEMFVSRIALPSQMLD